MSDFTPFPYLATERLALRPLELQDENEIFFLRSDERVLRFLQIPKAETIQHARNYIDMINTATRNDESILWGINLKNDPILIGTICLWNIAEDRLSAEIGYVLHPDFQGLGIMQEALVEVVNYGFNTMKLHSIEAGARHDNVPSIKLLEKNGFAFNRTDDDYFVYVRKAL